MSQVFNVGDHRKHVPELAPGAKDGEGIADGRERKGIEKLLKGIGA